MQSAKAELRAFLHECHFPAVDQVDLDRWVIGVSTTSRASSKKTLATAAAAPPRARSPCLIDQILQGEADVGATQSTTHQWPVSTSTEPDWCVPWQRDAAIVASAAPDVIALVDDDDEDQMLFRQFFQHMNTAFYVEPNMPLLTVNDSVRETVELEDLGDTTMEQLLQMMREDESTQWRPMRHEVFEQFLLAYYKSAQYSDRKYPEDPRIYDVRVMLRHPQKTVGDLHHFHQHAFPSDLAFPRELVHAYYLSRETPEVMSIVY